jgi:CoA-dependent NAD(P)H sulfur oxidoreductase
VTLESGAHVPYERLVIATGGRVDVRGIEGADAAPHAFTLLTIEDAERIRTFLRDRRPQTAAVVGAGYIGIEAADALRRNGLAVTIFEASPHALLRNDDAFTDAVRKQLERHKVELRTGVRIANLDDLRYDMIVIANGFKPNVDLPTAAGIELGRTGAIRTDERMETNLRGVYAAGDCAEVTHLVTGRQTWIPLGTTANKTGRVAGANAAGARERFAGIVGTSIVSIFGMGFATTGFSAAQARAEGFTPVVARIEANSKPKYYGATKTTVELVADRATRRLVGGCVIGEDGTGGRVNVIASALHARMRVEELEQLDLAYSPPFSPTWDPVLIAAQQLMKQF